MATGYAVQDRLAKATTGEQRTYRWLCDALPDEFDVWHEPRVGGSKPDVVVFGPDLGLLVLEVKDWSADAIVGVDAGRSVHLRSTTDDMRGAVCAVLYPDTTVRRTYAGRIAKTPVTETQQIPLPLAATRTMSLDQRQVALELSGGHQVLQGVAGSGKSEVVGARARILADANPAWRIVVLCFNVSLAAWLRSRVFEGGALQGNALTVVHFHEWARDLLDRAGIGYARRIYDHQDAFPQLVLDALRDGRITQRYDAVLVDEGQDFSIPMLQACLAALEPGRETFLLALDNAQKIYDGADVPLSSAGIRARGNAKILKVNHRCSREINDFSRRFLWGEAEEGATIRVGDQSAIVPISSDRCGEPVEVHRCDDVRAQAAWAAARCQELASQGWTPDEVAVLYASSYVDALGMPVGRDAAGGIDLVALLEKTFADAQVPLHWLSRDRGTKADAVLDHGGVTLSTVHSFKGLEARVVVLFGMDRSRDGAGSRPQGKALLYVGMTRATHRLLVPWSSAEGFGVDAEALGG